MKKFIEKDGITLSKYCWILFFPEWEMQNKVRQNSELFDGNLFRKSQRVPQWKET